MLAAYQPDRHPSTHEAFGQFGNVAARRGHVLRGEFSGGEHDLILAYAADADLDSEFEATCLVSGDLLRVDGWQFTQADYPAAHPAEPRNRAALHPVLHGALASGAYTAPVMQLIRDWGERDPIDAMQDARLLARAVRQDPSVVDRPDASRAARRAYRDWLRDYGDAERVANTQALVSVLTEWADTVLQEAIESGR